MVSPEGASKYTLFMNIFLLTNNELHVFFDWFIYNCNWYRLAYLVHLKFFCESLLLQAYCDQIQTNQENIKNVWVGLKD